MQKLIGMCFLFLAIKVSAQLPDVDIFYMYIGGNEDSGYVYSEPLNITNRSGYDNQPAFSKDGSKILFASIRDEKQADIYIYDCVQQTTQQFSKTPESEYSPEVTPDGKYISVVRVEQDSAQRLWKMKLKNAKAKVMLQFIYDIGYYCRLTNDKIALFQLPEPFELKMASLREQNAIKLDENIGRSIKTIPGENAFAYLVKTDTMAWDIKKCDMLSGNISQVKTIGTASEDFAWRNDGNLFMANGSAICYFDYQETNAWYLLDDFSRFGVSKIYRIAFSQDGNWMAFVAEVATHK